MFFYIYKTRGGPCGPPRVLYWQPSAALLPVGFGCYLSGYCLPTDAKKSQKSVKKSQKLKKVEHLQAAIFFEKKNGLFQETAKNSKLAAEGPAKVFGRSLRGQFRSDFGFVKGKR